jgi:hypothetical protein
MRSILVLLEDLVQAEFGPRELAAVRASSSEHLHDVGRLPGAPGRVMAFVEAIADVRRRPVHEVYQFVAMKLVPLVLKEYSALLKGHTSSRTVLMQITRLAPVVLDTLIPGIPYAEFDVELIDLDTMRVRFEGPAEMLAAFEGIALGLAQHYGERVEATRVPPPAFAPDRRMLDLKVGAERRDLKTPPRVPGGQDARRKLGI